MASYIFYHYGTSEDASCFSFAEFGSDDEAAGEAHRLLMFDSLRTVEICEGDREVGAVRPDPGSGAGAPA